MVNHVLILAVITHSKFFSSAARLFQLLRRRKLLAFAFWVLVPVCLNFTTAAPVNLLVISQFVGLYVRNFQEGRGFELDWDERTKLWAKASFAECKLFGFIDISLVLGFLIAADVLFVYLLHEDHLFE